MIQAIRFFRALRLWHPMMAGSLGLAVGVSGCVLALKGVGTPAALAPLFLLQTLAVSLGFAVPARRGHYDLLLSTGNSRLRIGLVHWAMSAAPGMASWLSLAAVELVITGGRANVSCAPGTVVGLVLVSTLPWAATVPLPRLAGGIAWITLLVFIISVLPASSREALMTGADGEYGLVARSMAVLVCPWILAGRDLGGDDMLPAVLALAAAVTAVVAALVWIDRTDIPLEAAQ